MSLEQFLSRYLELTNAIGEAIDRGDWDEVNRRLEERASWIQNEGQKYASTPPHPLTETQQQLLRHIRDQDEKNHARLQGQRNEIQTQIRQNQVTRQAVRGYMEEGLVREGLHSTLFNRGV